MGRYVYKLPDVGEGTAEAEVVAWHVKVGDMVEEDQNIVDVMTDKATVEMTSPIAGKVTALHYEPGQLATVGGPLMEFEVEGAGNAAEGEAAAPAAAAPPPAVKAEAPKAAPAPKPAPPAPKSKPSPATSKGAAAPQGFTPRSAGEKPLASPAVRQRARDMGIDLRLVQGTGPAGRIAHDDLDAYVRSGGRPAGGGLAPREGVNDVKIIGLRRKISEKMQDVKRRVPHIGYVEEIDMTETEALRVHLNATKKPDAPKLTLLPFFMRALVKALPGFPQINAHYDDEAGVLHEFAPVHIGIATQTDQGLLVPVVRHAEALDLWQSAGELARLAEAARTNTATKEDLSGSTITITSLGPLAGISTTPIINAPEVAIIGPNAVKERVVPMNGGFSVRKMMNLSSSFDHRIVDGYDAALLVRRMKDLLEHPATLFMD